VLRPIEHPLSFKPGQWISLQLPVGDHPPLNRAYSLAEPPSTAGHLTLVFDHVPGGKGSGYLASLKPGERIPLSGPYGHFVLPDSAPQHLLIDRTLFWARPTALHAPRTGRPGLATFEHADRPSADRCRTALP
jgi:NAD(P)H-flavin reductase